METHRPPKSNKELGKQSAFVTTNNSYQLGLTKREYFAAMAMQGLMVDSTISFNERAELAVEQADALIKKLSESSGTE